MKFTAYLLTVGKPCLLIYELLHPTFIPAYSAIREMRVFHSNKLKGYKYNICSIKLNGTVFKRGDI